MNGRLQQTVQEAIDAAAAIDTGVRSIDRILLEMRALVGDHHKAVSAVLEGGQKPSGRSEIAAIETLETRFEQQYLRLQMMMQRESRAFTSISNILKTKHDTVKNSIGNVK